MHNHLFSQSLEACILDDFIDLPVRGFLYQDHDSELRAHISFYIFFLLAELSWGDDRLRFWTHNSLMESSVPFGGFFPAPSVSSAPLSGPQQLQAAPMNSVLGMEKVCSSLMSRPCVASCSIILLRGYSCAETLDFFLGIVSVFSLVKDVLCIFSAGRR